MAEPCRGAQEGCGETKGMQLGRGCTWLPGQFVQGWWWPGGGLVVCFEDQMQEGLRQDMECIPTGTRRQSWQG